MKATTQNRVLPYHVMKGSECIARCGCLSEAVYECREHNYLSSEALIVQWYMSDDSDFHSVSKLYNVYGEGI